MTAPPTTDVDRYALMPSPVGRLLLTARDGAITGCWFTDEGDDLGPRLAGLAHDEAALADATQQLAEYFDGRRTSFDLALAPVGTDFQRRVWGALQTIPYGETRSYGQLAALVGNPKGSRAVGLANGRNPISIIVPCHRVIGADGSLTGYGGGMARKRTLLDLERGVLPFGA